MPLNLASPGIVVKEVDLTIGRIDPTSNAIGGIVAPFSKGPVDVPILINNESDLLQNFGEPYATDKHYEHWMVSSSYLAYGGSLRVVRSDSSNLKNGFAGTASSIKIKSVDDYNNLGYDENTITDVTFVAKNPGSWSNGLKVAIIDAKADQILIGVSTLAVTNTTFVGVATASDGDIGITTTTITGITTTGITLGNTLKILTGIIAPETTVTSIGVGSIDISKASLNTVAFSNVELSFGSYTTITTSAALQVGYGITQSIAGRISPGAGSTSVLDGYLKGIITGIGSQRIDVKVLSHVSVAGTETEVDYQPSGVYAFSNSGSVAIHTNGQSTSHGNAVYTVQQDWFDQQTISLSNNSTISWNNLADRPSTSSFAAARNSRFDEIHVVVIDDKGSISGNSRTILEKHLGLSKAKNAEFSLGSPSYWRKYIASNSQYIFGGSQPTGTVKTGFTSSFTLVTDGSWDKDTNSTIFNCTGANTLTFTKGKNYDSGEDINSTGSLVSSVGDISSGYDIFSNSEEYEVDFLLMGSANYRKESAQAIANKLISVAEQRKSSIAFISPYRLAFLNDSAVGTVTVNSSANITREVIGFYSPISSSSYAIFDSGYKYMYDKFSDTFRYVPLNGDIAGLCARNDINNFPWFSPAGTTRGAILNAVKLAYNPNKSERDRLYSNRINSVIFTPGSGIVLFGDKTALAKSSAFDRINVRRLFIYLENAISSAAKDQLFEFNDETTRSNFVNIIDPFLRDIQAKRGIQDFRVICDETNNTASIIDNNEFVADIFIKPNRSINFIGLTFVATRSGVSFEEIIGTV